MTQPSNNAIDPSVKSWFATWQEGLQNVLTQVAGRPLKLASLEMAPPAVDTDLCFLVVASGAVRGEMTLRVPSTSAVQLAQIFMGEPISVGDLTPERQEAVAELLRQVAGHVATSVAHPGAETQLQLSAASAPSWPAAASVTLQLTERESPMLVEVKVSAALAAALRPSADDGKMSVASGPTAPVYDRFLGVPLEVKIRFGSRRMVLRDVLALSTGAVLELDRNLQSPVDLLLDGRIIAQGEVVVIDGKYGLRVTEVFGATPLC